MTRSRFWPSSQRYLHSCPSVSDGLGSNAGGALASSIDVCSSNIHHHAGQMTFTALGSREGSLEPSVPRRSRSSLASSSGASSLERSALTLNKQGQRPRVPKTRLLTVPPLRRASVGSRPDSVIARGATPSPGAWGPQAALRSAAVRVLLWHVVAQGRCNPDLHQSPERPRFTESRLSSAAAMAGIERQCSVAGHSRLCREPAATSLRRLQVRRPGSARRALRRRGGGVRHPQSGAVVLGPEAPLIAIGRAGRHGDPPGQAWHHHGAVVIGAAGSFAAIATFSARLSSAPSCSSRWPDWRPMMEIVLIPAPSAAGWGH